uniref:Uncharacterized protein n=1 Tax=Arundo donax TaxID=35708 RepID=A0A0A8Z876_ARUDO
MEYKKHKLPPITFIMLRSLQARNYEFKDKRKGENMNGQALTTHYTGGGD